MENRDTMLSDGVDYRIGVYGSSEAGEMHLVQQVVLGDNIEESDVKVLIFENNIFTFALGIYICSPILYSP
jgi:hypothetical protein